MDSDEEDGEAGGKYDRVSQCLVWKDEDRLLHRDGDEPAIIAASGAKFWYKHGKLTRDGNPAYKHMDGSYMWYENDVLHRLTGNATYCAITGISRWFIAGEEFFTEEEFSAARDKYCETHGIRA